MEREATYPCRKLHSEFTLHINSQEYPAKTDKFTKFFWEDAGFALHEFDSIFTQAMPDWHDNILHQISPNDTARGIIMNTETKG
jgi:hypothetical protein